MHTPGPWFHSCDEGNDSGYCNVNVGPNDFNPDGLMIATVEEVDDGTHDEQREANARLIAAAPALLAALEDASALLDALSEGYADIGMDTRIIRRRKEARAAIAQATGEDK